MSEEQKRTAQIAAVLNAARFVTEDAAETCALLVGSIIVHSSQHTSTTENLVKSLQIAIDSLTLAQQLAVAKAKPDVSASGDGGN